MTLHSTFKFVKLPLLINIIFFLCTNPQTPKLKPSKWSFPWCPHSFFPTNVIALKVVSLMVLATPIQSSQKYHFFLSLIIHSLYFHSLLFHSLFRMGHHFFSKKSRKLLKGKTKKNKTALFQNLLLDTDIFEKDSYSASQQ